MSIGWILVGFGLAAVACLGLVIGATLALNGFLEGIDDAD